MSQTQDTIVAALMEQLIAEGPDGMAQVFTTLFNLAMRLERERFLGAGLYERNADRRGINLAEYPHAQRWFDAINARPAVRRDKVVDDVETRLAVREEIRGGHV